MSIFGSLKGKKQAVAIGLGIVLGVAGLAKAMVVTNSCASVSECTLSELIGGGSIMVDDVSFTGFQSASIPSLPNPGSIIVSGLGAGTSNVGLRFNGGRNWLTDSAFSQQIRYFVSVSGGNSIINQSLSLGANSTIVLGSNVGVDTRIFPGSSSVSRVVVNPFSPTDFDDGFMETGFNAITLINLAAANNSLTGIGGFDQTFGLAAVPIPAAVWLFGSAVMLVLGFRKRPTQTAA